MKVGSLIALLFTLIGVNHAVVGQSQNAKEAFPSYDQIRQIDPEAYDYVNRDGTARIVVKDTLNLFNYPSGTVTYILNGKTTDNANFARRVLSRKGTTIESLSVRQPDQLGKRTIEVKYQPAGK